MPESVEKTANDKLEAAAEIAELRQAIAHTGAQTVIPSTRSRSHPITYDKVAYKQRNLIERCFNKLKHFRRFATRYDRRASYFLAFIHLAASMIWMR